MENKGTENRNRATVTVSKDEVIAKLKDDGDFDRLRLKIIRKLKDDEELRNNIISAVKQSAALNRAGAENMKPRQLSDAIYEEVGSKVMSQMSDGVWKIIRSEDGMKSEIVETVQTVYDKLVNPGGTRVGDSSTSGMMAVTKEAGSHSPSTFSSGKVDDTVSDYEPKEPPGFSLPHNHDDNNHEKQPQDRLQVPVTYNKEPVEESKGEKLTNKKKANMVNIITIYKLLLHGLLKLVGMTQRTIEIEPGTILNIWVPKKTTKKHAVVLLHPFGFDGILTWQFQVLALAKTYEVYVPDFLFFGSSVTDRPDRTASFQAECMAKGLRKLGVEKCTLVGVSYGGMVGFKMAEMYPDLVESVVVSCSVMGLTESVSNAALERIGYESWVDFLLPKTVDAFKVQLDIACYKLPTLPAFVYKHILEALSDNRKERIELLQALVISDKEFSIPHFSQKIHLLWGENDKIFDMQVARNLKQQVGQNATMESIEKAGHLVNLERPFVYNRQLKTILASLVHANGQHN